MTLVVSAAAQSDLARLRAFLAEKNPSAANRVAAVLIVAIQSIETFPERGKPSEQAGVRELIVPFAGSGYILRYAYLAETDEAVVLRVMHGRERRE